MNRKHIFGMFFLLTVGIAGFGFMHEQVHVAIYSGYGIDSHVEYFSHFPDLVTIAEEPCPTDSCTLAHDINEAISYPLLVVFVIAELIYIVSIIAREDKNE